MRNTDLQCFEAYKKIIPNITLKETKKILTYIDRNKYYIGEDYKSDIKWLYKKVAGRSK